MNYKNKIWLYDQYCHKELSEQKIAEICGISRSTLQYWFKKFNIPKRDRKTAANLNFKDQKYRNKEWLYDQYINKKKSIRDIAKENKGLYNTIRDWLINYNIPIRSSSEAQILVLDQNKSTIKRGQPLPDWIKKKISVANSGEKNGNYGKFNEKHPNWKGIKANQKTKHVHINKHKKQLKICKICNKEKRVELSFDHSLGEYTRNPDDYKWLCHKCHFHRDKNEFNIKHFGRD